MLHSFSRKFCTRIESPAPECQYQNPSERDIKGVGAMFCRQNYLSNGISQYWHGLMASNVCPNETSGEYSPEYYLTSIHPNLSRFRFYYVWPTNCFCHFETATTEIYILPYGEFGYAVGSANKWNGSTLVYVPSKIKI